jgi:tetratricopeptide (TPR) repeat protein
MLARLRGEGRRALDLHRQQLDLALAEEAPAWQAEAWDQLGMDYELLNDQRRAEEALRHALEILHEVQDREAEAGSLNRLGLVLMRQGRLKEAAALLERAGERFAALDLPYEQAQVEGNLGNLAYAQAAWDQAEAHYRRALTLFDALGVIFDKVGVLNNLGSLAVAREAWSDAELYYKESLALARELGDQREVRDVLINLGVCHVRQGRYLAARDVYRDALALTRDLRDRGGIRDLRSRLLRVWLLRALQWLRTQVLGSFGSDDG